MAKDTKKTEKPAGEDTPPAGTLNPGSALVRLKQVGIQVPSMDDLDKLALASQEKLAQLGALLSDSEITDVVKVKVTDLLAQANPIKPGMEEVNTTWSV